VTEMPNDRMPKQRMLADSIIQDSIILHFFPGSVFFLGFSVPESI